MRIQFLLLFVAFTASTAACATPTIPPTVRPTQVAIVQTRVVTAIPMVAATTTRATTAIDPTTVTPTTLPLDTTPTPTSEPSATPTSEPTPMPTASPVPASIQYLSACGEIWQPGYYKLSRDIKSLPGRDCFYIQSHNVIFDCDNHTIEGNVAGIKEHQYQFYAFFVRKFNFPLLETPTNVEIKNCRISHQRTGIFVGGGNNIWIHDNDLSNNSDDVNSQRFGIFLGMTEGGGLRLDSVQGGRVENNTTNGQAIGIDIRDSNNILVRNNTANGNSAWGISLLNTSNSQVIGNTTRDNIRYCAWGDGTVGRGCDAGGIILHDGSSYDLVQGNIIAGENGNGIFIKAHGERCGDDNLLQNNKITDAVYNAIEFSFCKDNQVIGNEITGSYDAIWFGFSINTTIRDNVIRNMNNHGISGYNSRDTLVTGNQITNSREGIYFYWEAWDPKKLFFLPADPNGFPSRNNTITGNTLRDNAAAAIHLTNSTQTVVNNNTFGNNAKNVWIEGKSDGNTIASK